MTEQRRRIGLGGALRRAWVGYRIALDRELDRAGFGDHGFPDGRVLRLCSRSEQTTISDIGRDLGVTRQGASKIVAGLRARGYVRVADSATDRREKIVRATARAAEYLAAHRRAARKIESELSKQLGPAGLESLAQLLEALGDQDQPRMRDYLRRSSAEL